MSASRKLPPSPTDRCYDCAGTGIEDRAYGPAPCDLCHGTGHRPAGMATARAAAELWAAAASIADLGRLTAAWVRGELPYCLLQGASPDPETREIAGPLAALNEAGWLTDFSQPAFDWKTGWDGETQWRQRAAVTFLIDPTRAHLTVAVAETAGLIVEARRAPLFGFQHRWQAFRQQLWVTEVCEPDDLPYPTCGIGFAYNRSHWHWAASEHGNPRIGAVLADAWQVNVVDPIWGRRDVLWSAMTALAATYKDPA
jgi:hypothetical protein